jgi:hypothetical protein
VLISWEPGVDPDKNSDGLVCVPPLTKDRKAFFDTELIKKESEG